MKTSQNKLYLLLLGLFWVVFFMYMRIFFTKTPYDIPEIKNVFLEKQLLFGITFITLHFIIICVSIYSLRLSYEQKKTIPKFVHKLQDIYTTVFIAPLTYIRNLIAPKIPYSGIFFCKIAAFMENKGAWRFKALVVLFYILPRSIVASIFFIELVFYQRIYYFVFSLAILLIPLIWLIFVNLFTDFGYRGLVDIPKYVNIIPLGDPLPNGWYSRYRFEPFPQYKYSHTSVDEYRKLYFLSMSIWAYGETFIQKYQRDTMPYITLYTSTLYMVATSYKMFLLCF